MSSVVGHGIRVRVNAPFQATSSEPMTSQSRSCRILPTHPDPFLAMRPPCMRETRVQARIRKIHVLIEKENGGGRTGRRYRSLCWLMAAVVCRHMRSRSLHTAGAAWRTPQSRVQISVSAQMGEPSANLCKPPSRPSAPSLGSLSLQPSPSIGSICTIYCGICGLRS